ncbi:MAG: UDP-N-acetylmuramoylalanine--D-glutamate ligase [Chlamydiales bacterium]|nr:UDP-N-acetylmuramoylalanine--D-glutamate ligase [Chlamydiales bacterium]MCH9635380.1 UDP-N-acetylmuramoylalanine--D-glutamate ligase [Chlamydiales bacterium]MCH9704205.1 hypothetical protein [Chlamydiota bacterium]
MKRTIILGSGVSGRAAKELLEKRGEHPIILEGDESFEFQPDDLVIKSPGIRLDHPWVKAAPSLIDESELGLKELQGIVLAITGSCGKTTTAQLVAHVTGATACGNIGTAVCSVTQSDLYVVELSSFQLATMQGGGYFDAAVILNISPNHLDWHPNFEHYKRSKERIVRGLKPGAPLWCSFSPKRVERILPIEYRSEKNQVAAQNVAAAWMLCQHVGISEELFFEKLASFEKPPHRLELVKQVRGVDYINDSKATCVKAVKNALASVGKPIHLIVGGVDKGGDFTELLDVGVVRSVYAIGEASARIKEELHEACSYFSLEEAVVAAAKAAKSGECVLLSPGCSSFDCYQSYEERGAHFREIVEGIR